MALMAYAPLGYGFLAGAANSPGAQAKDDIRGCVSQLENFAASMGLTAAQISLAWLLSQGENIFPIPGCKSRMHLSKNFDTIDVKLTSENLVRLDKISHGKSVDGGRYPPNGMKRVNL